MGLRNFQDIFTDPVGLQSIWVTLRFNLIVNPLQIGLALLLALLINQALRGIDFFRSIYLLPIAISLNVTAIIWGLMLNQNGLMNGLLRTVGLPAQPFLIDQIRHCGAIIMMASWVGVAYWALFLLAGLQGIPPELYEAAEIDGAGVMQRFIRHHVAAAAQSAGVRAGGGYDCQLPALCTGLDPDQRRAAIVNQYAHV